MEKQERIKEKKVFAVIEPKMCAAIISRQKKLILTVTEPSFQIRPSTIYIVCGAENTDNPNEILEIHNNLGKIIKANRKIVGEFICYNTEHYETEFSKGNSVYQAISKIEYNEDDEDEESFVITSNEENNPDDNDLCKLSLKSFEEIKTMCGAEDAEFWGLPIDELIVYERPIEMPQTTENDLIISENPICKQNKDLYSEETLAEIKQKTAEITAELSALKKSVEKDIFHYVRKLRRVENIMRKLYIIKGSLCAASRDCSEYDEMIVKAKKAKRGYEERIAHFLRESGRYEAHAELFDYAKDK